MSKSRVLGITLIVLLLQFTAVFAVPVIESFELQYVFPAEIQITWKISDDSGLARLEVFEDGNMIYKEKPTGTKQTSLYQIRDDNESHTFELIVYNVFNQSAKATVKSGSDRDPPLITTGLNVFSNKPEMSFGTDENSVCRAGFDKSDTKVIDTDYSKTHTAELFFDEGSTTVYVTCSDEYNNAMVKFSEFTFVLDKKAPGKVSGLKFERNNDEVIVTWTAAEDENGIASYKIYDSLKLLDTVDTNKWTVSTSNGIYFISAVDKAGNEGEKEEYNLGKELILSSPVEKAVEVKTEPAEEEKTASEMSTVSIIAWTAFTMLLLFFIGWKIYEHKTDKHGLRKYLKDRRRKGY